MARRRYISTEISVDKRINKFINKYGSSAGLLYTWMIPHADDDRSITADADELKMTVVPGVESISASNINKFILGMVEYGLVHSCNGKLYFPDESFYRYQSYIPENKRNHAMPQNADDCRETPQNAASPSPSPSPSLSPSLSPLKDIIMSADEARYMSVLEKIKNYPSDRERDIEYYHTLEERFPAVDLYEMIQDYAAYKIDHPITPKDNPRSQINTQCKKCIEWGKCLKTKNKSSNPFMQEDV